MTTFLTCFFGRTILGLTGVACFSGSLTSVATLYKVGLASVVTLYKEGTAEGGRLSTEFVSARVVGSTERRLVDGASTFVCL